MKIKKFLYEHYPSLALGLYPLYYSFKNRGELPADFPHDAYIFSLLHKDDIVLEGGANLGGLTRAFAERTAHVFAFEPSPLSFRWLKRNTKDLPNVTIVPLAVGENNEVRDFYEEWPLSGSNSMFAAKIGWKKTRVEARKIDGMPFQPSVLSLDIEGAELAALKGAATTLQRMRCVFIETHGERMSRECALLLLGAGFHISKVLDDGGMEWLIARRAYEGGFMRRGSGEG